MFVWPGGCRRKRNSEQISGRTCSSCKHRQALTRVLNYSVSNIAKPQTLRTFRILCGNRCVGSFALRNLISLYIVRYKLKNHREQCLELESKISLA